MYKKYAVTVILGILSAVVIICILFSLGTFKSKEEKVLDKICGSYNINELMYQTDSVLLSTTFEFAQMQQLKNKVVIDKHSFSIINKETNEMHVNQTNINYMIKEIDSDFLSNGIRSQGKTLRNGLIPLENDLKKLKHKYAIFIDTPAISNQTPPEHDRFVIYYLDEKLYLFNGFDMLRLETTKLNDIYSQDYPMSSEAIINSSQAEQQDEDLSFQLLDIEGNPLANARAVIGGMFAKCTNNNGKFSVRLEDIPFKFEEGECPLYASVFHFDGTEEIQNLSYEYKSNISSYQIKTILKSLKNEFKQAIPRIEVTALSYDNKPVENVFVDCHPIGESHPQNSNENDTSYKTNNNIEIMNIRSGYTDKDGVIYLPFMEKGKYNINVYLKEFDKECQLFNAYVNDSNGVTRITVKLE